MELKSSGGRSKDHDPAGTYAHQIFNRLLIDLSYNSSRLEGNTYSLLDTKKLLFHGETPEGKLDQEKVMILNHKEAIRHLVEKAGQIKIKDESIFTIHYLLSDGLVESKYAGKVRDHGVRIGGSTYIPFEDPPRLKRQLKRIADKAAKIQDPFEQSFFLLVHISYIQAFSDVNKRTARICANIPLIAQNFVPLSFNDVDTDDYMAAIIAIYEFQDLCPLADIYVYSYMRTCTMYDSTIQAMGFDEIRVRYRRERRELIRKIILKKLTGNPLAMFIQKEIEKNIPLQDRIEFMQDLQDDLDKSRIASLRVSPQELEVWQTL